MTMRPIALIAILLLATTLPGAESDEPAQNRPPLMEREREIALAKSAGPERLAEEATLYVLERSGYVKVQEGSNGFTCIVTHSVPGSQEPACYDAEASATYVAASRRKAELRAQGKSANEVKRIMEADYEAGRLRHPKRTGIIYMLSTENLVPDATTSQVVPYPPHLMFYAPGLTNADLGTKLAIDSPVFVVLEGTPWAMIIVPVDREKYR